MRHQPRERIFNPALMSLRPLDGLQKVEQCVKGDSSSIDGQERFTSPRFASEGGSVPLGHVGYDISLQGFHGHPSMGDMAQQVEDERTNRHKAPPVSRRVRENGLLEAPIIHVLDCSDATGVLADVKHSGRTS